MGEASWGWGGSRRNKIMWGRPLKCLKEKRETCLFWVEEYSTLFCWYFASKFTTWMQQYSSRVELGVILPLVKGKHSLWYILCFSSEFSTIFSNPPPTFRTPPLFLNFPKIWEERPPTQKIQEYLCECWISFLFSGKV